MTTVDVILPVLDEAEAVPLVIAAMPAGYHPIVVDNGSTDGSADIARDHGATVVEEPRRGFGSACYRGLLAAEADIVCFLDCDGSFDPGDLPAVVEPVAANRADLVLGARSPVDGGGPLHAAIANRYLAGRVRQMTGAELTDIGPMRAARREDLLALGIRDRRSGWPLEMILRAADSGWRIVERPVPYYSRVGRSKVTGTLRGTTTAIIDMRRALTVARRLADFKGMR